MGVALCAHCGAACLRQQRGPSPDFRQAGKIRAAQLSMRESDLASGRRTLAIDIGGSGTKALVLDPYGKAVNKKVREPTPDEPTPERVLAVLDRILSRQPSYDRVAAGFPGVVTNGITLTAVNLHPEWIGFDLGHALCERTGKPAKVANDADVQGMAVISGNGLEMVLTLGTGLGSSLYIDGKLVPNLEIAHHVFRKNKTYEEHLGNAALQRKGRGKWSRYLRNAVAQLQGAFNFERLYIGGGNSRKAARAGLAGNVTFVSNLAGLLGGFYLWDGPGTGSRSPDGASPRDSGAQ